MKLDTDTLRQSFQMIDQVGAHAGLLSSQFIKMTFGDKLSMNLSGLAIAGTTLPVLEKDPAPWTFYLDRRMLAGILSTTSAKTVSLNLDKDVMTILAGKQKAIIPGISAIVGYSSWKPKDTLKTLKLTDDLRAELNSLADYAPMTAAADHLAAVYMIKGYGIIATDSISLSAYLDSGISETFPLPVILTKLVANNGDALKLDDRGAGIRNAFGYVYQTLNPKCSTDYPLTKVQKAIEAGLAEKTGLEIPIKRLYEGFQYLNSFIFGSAVDVMVEVFASPQSTRMVMKTSQGEVRREIPDTKVSSTLYFKWRYEKVNPWLEHVHSVDEKAQVH